MKKIKVTFNWNRPKGKEIIVQVPEDWGSSQINAVLEKKYGKYDILNWIEVPEIVAS